jgi:hypothetical protein
LSLQPIQIDKRKKGTHRAFSWIYSERKRQKIVEVVNITQDSVIANLGCERW